MLKRTLKLARISACARLSRGRRCPMDWPYRQHRAGIVLNASKSTKCTTHTTNQVANKERTTCSLCPHWATTENAYIQFPATCPQGPNVTNFHCCSPHRLKTPRQQTGVSARPSCRNITATDSATNRQPAISRYSDRRPVARSGPTAKDIALQSG